MITAQIELFMDVLPELKPLLPAHYAELALDKEDVPLDPDYDEYARREEAGAVLFITLREAGALVGYFIGFLSRELHYRSCYCLQLDIFWVSPSHRGRKGGSVLFSAVEAEARRRGVNRWFMGGKEHAISHVEPLLLGLGFKLVERRYSKWLGG